MKLKCLKCFRRKKKEKPSEESFIVYKRNEPTDYVVEKQVIKCVPVRLYTTEQDMVSQRTTVASVTSEKPKSYESYYSTSEKSDIKSVSHASAPVKYESAHTLGDNVETESKIEPCRAPCHKYILSEEEERQLVSQVLNALSSLHTLDPKESVPKDTCPVNRPCNPPNAPVCIPPHLAGRAAKLYQPCQNVSFLRFY